MDQGEQRLAVGVDLCAVGRMVRELSREGGGFGSAVFTPAEAAWCEASADPPRRFAAVFAAKEAVFKSLAPCRVPSLVWDEIEIFPGAGGEPLVRLRGGTARRAGEHGVVAVRVSLTCTASVAAAVAVAVARA